MYICVSLASKDIPDRVLVICIKQKKREIVEMELDERVSRTKFPRIWKAVNNCVAVVFARVAWGEARVLLGEVASASGLFLISGTGSRSSGPLMSRIGEHARTYAHKAVNPDWPWMSRASAAICAVHAGLD